LLRRSVESSSLNVSPMPVADRWPPKDNASLNQEEG
jgi:hypothetical protein